MVALADRDICVHDGPATLLTFAAVAGGVSRVADHLEVDLL